MLVGADADMIGTDDLGHLLQPVDVFVEAREEVPDADRSAGLRDRPRMVGADLPLAQRGWAHRPRPGESRMRQQQGFGRDFDRLLHHVLGRVRDVADKTELVTRTDHFSAARGEPLMHNGPGLEIADLVRRVVYELYVPDAALMRFLEPLELSVDEVEPLHVGHDCGFPRSVRRLEIGGGKGTTHTM